LRRFSVDFSATYAPERFAAVSSSRGHPSNKAARWHAGGARMSVGREGARRHGELAGQLQLLALLMLQCGATGRIS